MRTTSSVTLERDRIPLLQKVMFASGENMNFACTGLMMTVLWMPFFNIGLGMKPYVLGVILMVYRAWDAVTDPWIANLSDNFRSRWGRRRPFLVAGALLTAAVYPFFWHMPAGLSDAGRIAYLTGVGLVYFLCYTLWSMPYYGMQMELTPDYDERTRLAAWCSFFGKLGYLAGGWVLAFATGARFLDPATGKPDVVRGVQVVCWGIAGVILVIGLLPPLFVSERPVPAAGGGSAPAPSLWRSIRESARCGPLWNLVGGSFFLVVGSGAVGTLGQYLNFYYVNAGDLHAATVIGGWKSSVTVAAGIAGIPFWTRLARRHDKRTMVVAMMLTSMGGHLLNYVCLTPAHPYLQIVSGVFESAAISAIWLFVPSMKADTADYDEWRTRRRREGSLNAFFSWFVKVAHTLSFFLGGVLLETTGFADPALARQPPEVLARMFTIYIWAPIIVWALGLWCLWRYPLGRGRMARMRGLLERRRGLA